MGDRGNVFCREQYEKEGGVYLYSHWGGSELPRIVQDVLKRRQRWDDGPYLTRMIFSAMIKEDIDDEVGYGISVTLGDNGHPIVVVDTNTQTVGFAHEGKEPKTYVQWSFKEYIQLDEQDLTDAFEG